MVLKPTDGSDFYEKLLVSNGHFTEKSALPGVHHVIAEDERALLNQVFKWINVL